MPRTEDRSIRDRVSDLERLAERLAPVHVRTWIIVCQRDEPWSTALTCAADLEGLIAGEHGHPGPLAPRPVRVLERRRDLDLLIDPASGARRLRTSENAERFDALSEGVELVEIEITVHEAQLPALISNAPVVGVLGGNRSGKTRIGIYWEIRQWMLRGGPGAIFWILAPTDLKAWKRLGRPEDGIDTVSFAALLPDRLRVSELPRGKRAKLEIELVDGSIFEALNTFGDGDNLKSEKVAAILFDEAAASPKVGNWQQCLSRTTQGGARVMVATTPKAGHWAYTEIVLHAPHSGGQIEVYNLDLFQNPWLTSAEIWTLLLSDGTVTATELDEVLLVAADPAAACRALVESPRALREHFGVWTADGITLWSEWPRVAKDCVRAGQGTGPERWEILRTDRGELPNITPQVASKFFYDAPGDLRQVWGQDFNINPQSCVRVQVHGHAAQPDSWTLFFIEEVQTRGTLEAHAGKMDTTAPGASIACDPSGDIPRRSQEPGDGDEAGRMRQLGFDCKSAVGRGRRLRSQSPTLALIHKLMRQRRVYIHARCKQTLRAMQMQRATPDGRIDKRAGTNSPSDKASSTTDAMRYVAWALMRHELEGPVDVRA